MSEVETIYRLSGSLKVKDQYSTSSSITRSKTLILPKHKKKNSTMNSYMKALTTYNKLPSDLKTLNIKKYSQE